MHEDSEDNFVYAIVDPGPNIRLASEPNANTSVIRDRARATHDIAAGSLILTSEPSATALLLSEKGKRCDFCHTQLQSVLRCKGCASYYYCDRACQTSDWQYKHKKICKTFNAWMASGAIQSLEEHLKMDMILLTHLIAEMAALRKFDGIDDPHSEIKLFTTMMKNPQAHLPNGVEMCRLHNSATPSREHQEDMYTRFGRNNFAMHSHFKSFAHGVYPLASRVFNHSCAPNAAAKYIITKCRPVRMEVVALSDIKKGEEIFLSYIDPALVEQRLTLLGYTYGFMCECPSCKYLQTIGGGFNLPNITPPPPDTLKDLLAILDIQPCTAEDLWTGRKQLPNSLKFIFSEEFLTKFTKIYSDCSHDGPLERAISVGELIWHVYKLIYPPTYPLLGLHCLEQAKTTWNAIVKDETGKDPRELNFIPTESAVVTFRKYLDEAKKILEIIGEEGDPNGPLEEIRILEENFASL